MVTSNKHTDKKVVKMTTQNNNAVVPHRTLLGEVNEHITCPLCRGYYIDATTIVECLHSFCRSCIIKHLQVKKYCPVCEMMINSAKPNIKLDKALQDIVYKLVPGLFQKEMERRQAFYASRPGPAASATPEQRGEDTERIIFSPEDVISFSLEYSDVTDTDSISSKSSDSNEAQTTPSTSRRYLQCPAVVNISHLKKFLSMKFDIDSTQFAIDILYKRVPLPDYYTLMDIAYIYNWKRNEPMRFFYQIIDYVAIRNRLFDVNRKTLQEKKPAVLPENSNSNQINQNSELSSTDGTGFNENVKKSEAAIKVDNENSDKNNVLQVKIEKRCDSPGKKSEDEDEKSQFLNSFELTAKNSSKTSPIKTTSENLACSEINSKVSSSSSSKSEESLKRKHQSTASLPELKKVKIELEKTKLPVINTVGSSSSKSIESDDKSVKCADQIKTIDKIKPEHSTKLTTQPGNSTLVPTTTTTRDLRPPTHTQSAKQHMEIGGHKRGNSDTPSNSTPKRKTDNLPATASQHKTVSPLKIQLSKTDSPTLISNKLTESPKVNPKKIPDLKPSTPGGTASNKVSTGKLRMDLLANNSDPTIDRSKILSQVKTSAPPSGPNTGDNLKSLFDSCKINIPSSLSITLTDQKSPSDPPVSEQKKNFINKNLTNVNTPTSHKVPSPPVHNYIEIKKLPDTDSKKGTKSDVNTDSKSNSNKTDNGTPSKPVKSSESSAKGPIPNLKPISDTKLAKQSVSSGSGPITFQQTFEQQLQSLQSDTKTKVPKNKAQVPKLVPATSKAFSIANKLNNPVNKPMPSTIPSGESKPTTALDLSTPHSMQSQLGPQQTKAFETMQSIANLAKKQSLPPKPIPLSLAQNAFPSLSNKNLSTSTPMRMPPGNSNPIKQDKGSSSLQQVSTPRQDITKQLNPIKQTMPSQSGITNIPSPNYQIPQPSGPAQPSPRSQTRSPSSSPKLVIAEEKQSSSSSSEHSQSNPSNISQPSSIFSPKPESPKETPIISKPGLKPMKPLMPPSKLPTIRQPITPTLNANSAMSSQADYLSQPLLSHAIFRHQMEMQNAWLKAQRQFDIFKNIPNMTHQSQNDFNNKDNKQ